MMQSGKTMREPLVKSLKELTVLLTEMRQLHEGLLSAIQRKMAAIRSADEQGMHASSRRERELADRIREQEGLRRVLMERVGALLGVGPADARKMSMRALAERVEEPARSRLLVLGNELRGLASEVLRLNRIVALVSREMINHFRNVYGTITRGGVDREVYGRTGRTRETATPALIDTTG